MLIIVSTALLVLAIFVYSANPKEGLNKWCFITIFLFSLGMLGESVTIEIMSAFGWYDFEIYIILFENITRWMMFTFAAPTATVTAFYWSYIDVRKKWKIIKCLVFIPSLFLVFFFPPVNFIEYTQTSKSFWITYSIYNLVLGVVIIAIMARGIIYEEKLNKGSILKKKHNRKMQEALIMLPPLYFAMLSEFPVRLFDVLVLNTINNSFQPLWQFQLVLVPICLVCAVYFSVNGGGFFGIRIIPERYSYKFQIIADDFIGNFIHRIKNETSYMIVKINKIHDALDSGSAKNNIDTHAEVINNLNELSEKIQNLNNLAKKFSRYSSDIRLNIAFWNLAELLNNAKRTDIKTQILIDDKVCLECDGSIMTEVFKDIIDNSVQSIEAKNMQEAHEAGEIVITETRDINKYKIKITDNGAGIPPNKLESIFYPGETTKNKEYNSGMGLSNCKKMIQNHGGDIFAESEGVGKGASIIITLPNKIVDTEGKNLANANKFYKEEEDII